MLKGERASLLGSEALMFHEASVFWKTILEKSKG